MSLYTILATLFNFVGPPYKQSPFPLQLPWRHWFSSLSWKGTFLVGAHPLPRLMAHPLVCPLPRLLAPWLFRSRYLICLLQHSTLSSHWFIFRLEGFSCTVSFIKANVKLILIVGFIYYYVLLPKPWNWIQIPLKCCMWILWNQTLKIPVKIG